MTYPNTLYPPPLDIRRLHGFTAGNPDHEKAMLDLFFHSAIEVLITLNRCMAIDDLEGWRVAAHKLKGSSGNMGAHALAEACERAEHKYLSNASEKKWLLENIRIALADVRQFVNHAQQKQVQAANA